MDPVSAGLGAVSLISGKQANDKARKEAKSAQSGSKALEQRAIKLWDVLFSKAEKADQEGTFDPEKRIAALEKDTAGYESRDLGNLSGALTTAGYQPGDSELGVRLDAVKGKYRKFLDNMRDQIRTSSFFDQQNAYATANPGYLAGPMQGEQNRGAMAQSQIQNPTGFLQNLLPSIRKPKAQFNLGVGSNASNSSYLPAPVG